MSIFPKLKIYVQLLNPGCHIYENPKGDMFDLRAATTVDMKCPQTGERYKVGTEYFRDTHFENTIVPLGVRILMPNGFRGTVPVRSGTYNKFKAFLANGFGVIDHPYNGPEDEWKANLIALDTCHIDGPREATEEDYLNEDLTIINGIVQGDRIAQFEITLSQKATFGQKLKWLFSSGVEIVYVDNIDTLVNRGGFNSSGIK